MTIIKKILLFALIAVLISSPTFARRGIYNPQKTCFSNMRTLLGAIEMYNMDNEEMLHELNDDVIDRLIKGKYIKEDRVCCPKKNEPGHYHNQGDLCDDGVIYCDYHGSVEGYGSGKGQVVPPSREYVMEERRREFQQTMNAFIPIIVIIGFIALICVMFSGKKKKG